jgi:hypothetical protein
LSGFARPVVFEEPGVPSGAVAPLVPALPITVAELPIPLVPEPFALRPVPPEAPSALEPVLELPSVLLLPFSPGLPGVAVPGVSVLPDGVLPVSGALPGAVLVVPPKLLPKVLVQGTLGPEPGDICASARPAAPASAEAVITIDKVLWVALIPGTP